MHTAYIYKYIYIIIRFHTCTRCMHVCGVVVTCRISTYHNYRSMMLKNRVPLCRASVVSDASLGGPRKAEGVLNMFSCQTSDSSRLTGTLVESFRMMYH